MKTKEKLNTGITLIALIITIVILLILAGIAISALSGENGLFTRAQQAKNKTVEAQIREEIIMAIQDIQTEELPKGNNVTLEKLAGGQLQKELKDITAQLTDGEINGEYKDYEYTIDSNLNVIINGEVTGVRIKGSAEVQSGYVFEGNTVEIKVTASITEGTITGIEAPEGAKIKTDTSATEKVYTVSKSGKYIFKITSNSGKTKNVTANVENILSAPQITVSEVTGNSFKINVENNYPKGAITEYKYSVGGEVKQQGTTYKSYTVTGLSEDTEYSNINVAAYIDTNTSKESNVEKVTTEMKDAIPYSWDEIAEIAKAISNDNTITDNSETATVNGKTLKVGQMKRLDGKKVRILGFNHDELAEPSKAYGTSTATGKAGISFEYVDFLTSRRMNTSNTNDGGWKNTELRGILNGTTYSSMITTYHIKKVKKDYIPTYNVASIEQTEDYLWLLSCGEIWETNGYTVEKDGKQYKYYKSNLGSTGWKTSNNIARKPNIYDSGWWWLRSTIYYRNDLLCGVNSYGQCGNEYPKNSENVAPGFSI